jgi:STE24 endopeptidase
MLFQMILTPLEAIFGLAMNALSRQFEWEADRFALELGHGSTPEDKDAHAKGSENSGDMGERLARALIALHAENLSTVWVDWLWVFPFSLFYRFL